MVERYAGETGATEVLQALAMLRSASVLLRGIEHHLSGHKLSQLRFLILVVVDRENDPDGLRQRDVADQIDVSKPVLSRAVRRLVQDGLLCERPDAADARALRLVPTTAGQAKLSEVLPGYFAIISDHMRNGATASDGGTCDPVVVPPGARA